MERKRKIKALTINDRVTLMRTKRASLMVTELKSLQGDSYPSPSARAHTPFIPVH